MTRSQALIVLLAVGVGTTVALTNGWGVPAAPFDQALIAGIGVTFIAFWMIRGLNAIYGALERRRGLVPQKRNSAMVSLLLTVSGVATSMYLWWYAGYALALVTAVVILVLGLRMVYVDYQQSRR